MQNANNEASPIRRHIELALCHLAQHGKLLSFYVRVLFLFYFFGLKGIRALIKNQIKCLKLLIINSHLLRSECKGHDYWGCPVGAGSHLARLFTGGHKDSCPANANFQPYLPC